MIEIEAKKLMRGEGKLGRPSRGGRWLGAFWMSAALLLGIDTAAAQSEVPLAQQAIPDEGYRPREDTYDSTRTMAMGSGARASAMGTAAITANPANLGLGRLYHIEAFSQFNVTQNYWAFGSAIADSITNRLAAGMSFRGILGNGDRDYRGYDGRLSLGLPVVEQFGIGISGRFLKVDAAGEDQSGRTIGPSLTSFNLDAAIRVTPITGLHIAALGYNFIQTDSPLAPLQLGGSASYAYENIFSIGGDFLVDLTTYGEPTFIFGGGVEYFVANMVPIRVGYRGDSGRGLHQVTGSVGYVSQQFSVDLALRQDVQPGEKQTDLQLALRYHVQ